MGTMIGIDHGDTRARRPVAVRAYMTANCNRVETAPTVRPREKRSFVRLACRRCGLENAPELLRVEAVPRTVWGAAFKPSEHRSISQSDGCRDPTRRAR